ncbi:MAG TPA: 2-phosphosulfolactate phosphatase [Bacteroidota bacterium]|nr:2-phosphosulfolactate phosphatase [Bacteroidota bacterium]
MLPKKQIHIEVHFTPDQLDEMQLKDKNIVVIDVLRASTTIATALERGAKEIIPVSTIENAVKISGNLFGEVTLRAGERNGKMIEGFNLGNSPLEYTNEVVKGKSIILMTTNGSVAIVKGRHAKHLVVAAFVNISAVTRFLTELKSDFMIICAGKEGHFCIEDAVCAGRIINKLGKGGSTEYVLDDGAVAAAALDKTFGKSIVRMLKSSEHGKYLASIGFGEDIPVCAQVDSMETLPTLSGNVIRIWKKSTA